MPKPRRTETPAEAPRSDDRDHDSGGKDRLADCWERRRYRKYNLDRPSPETGQFVRRPGTVQTLALARMFDLDSNPGTGSTGKVVLASTALHPVGDRPAFRGGAYAPADTKPDLFVSRKAKDQGNSTPTPSPPTSSPSPPKIQISPWSPWHS